MASSVALDLFDVLYHGVERCGHRLVHQFGLEALNEIRRPAVTTQQLIEFLAADAGEDRWAGNLVAIEMEDRQHCTIGGSVEKFVGMPGCGQWPGFCLAVTNHAGGNQIWIVKYGTEGMTQRIAKLTPLVNGAGAFGRSMARYATGK